MERKPAFTSSDGITYKATTILRKRKVTDDQLEKRAKMRIDAIKAKRLKMRNPDLLDKVTRPEKFIMAYREKQKNYVNQKKRGHLTIDDNLKGQIIMAVRIKGDKNLSDRQKILLKTLKLKKVHEAAVIRIDPKIEKFLKICEPFITYG